MYRIASFTGCPALDTPIFELISLDGNFMVEVLQTLQCVAIFCRLNQFVISG